jgi:DNA helicase-2/ATP-dependent DNA helicase PcrA
MTNRITQPDTDADLQLRACLDEQPAKSFVMVAGAGSGKTTSLVKALDHLARTRGSELKRRGQQIACITYTEVAVGEIWGDVGNAPLFHVSTIHSFLWSVVKPFQDDIRQWVESRISEKIAAAEEKIAKPRTQQRTRDRLLEDIDRYKAQLGALRSVKKWGYGTGSDYAHGILGHDDILKIGPALIADKALLRNIVASRYPVIFVDESQDTDPTFVEALKQIRGTAGEGFCLGFFGDPVQKIYMTGAGPIILEEAWKEITKPENFRCPQRVLHVINKIRAEDDGLVQTRGRTVEKDGEAISVEGSARIFLLPADDQRTEHLGKVREWLSQANDDPDWVNSGDQNGVRVLVLVHRMAAQRLGFPDIYASLNDHGPSGLKDGLLDGTAWVLRPFLGYLLPLVKAVHLGDEFAVISALRANSPLLTEENLRGKDVVALLAQLKKDVTDANGLFAEGSDATIRQVLQFVHDHSLMTLDDRFFTFLNAAPSEGDGEGLSNHDAAALAFLDCPAVQLRGYQTYIEDQSPFATHQGVKGAEFDRVLVVLDDEESNYNIFSYEKYFGTVALSDTDQKNLDEGMDSVVDRTRRLFYVCCSRAVQDLAVAWFVPDVEAARAALLDKGFFLEEDIHVF